MNSTLEHIEHVELSSRDKAIAFNIVGGDDAMYKTLTKTMLENEQAKAAQSIQDEKSAEPEPAKEYTDDWHGRQQKKYDNRITRIEKMIGEHK